METALSLPRPPDRKGSSGSSELLPTRKATQTCATGCARAQRQLSGRQKDCVLKTTSFACNKALNISHYGRPYTYPPTVLKC